MFTQPQDFADESKALYQLIKDKSDYELSLGTQFKFWTIEDIIGHLHVWNRAADMSLNDEKAFNVFLTQVMQALPTGNLKGFETEWLGDLKGNDLVSEWYDFSQNMQKSFGKADPRRRVMWAGPSMSVRSSITARLMETWAHGQAIYDVLGVERIDQDRLQNIVVLGTNTFEWTFKNQGETVPENMPYIRLTAPSGLIWQYGTPDNDNRILGCATEFCQVITQTRSIFDSKLKVKGDIAQRWMEIAQCFAGPPHTPPVAGERYLQTMAAADET
ncbi:MAG: TIGR03084 family protein [Robiginitomaculum sp.]|nr:MAG: TIGR03084 family protein [Robiginitomaculum sp.]